MEGFYARFNTNFREFCFGSLGGFEGKSEGIGGKAMKDIMLHLNDTILQKKTILHFK